MRSQIFALLSVLAGRNANPQLKRCEEIHNRTELEEFQNQQLKELIICSYRNVPYYHRLFQDCKLVENGGVHLERWGSVPVLTKEIVRENAKDLVSSDYKKRRWYYNYSGGSTGQPLKLMQDTHYQRWCDASYLYWYRHFVGIEEIKAKKTILWGSTRDLYQGSSGWKNALANWARNTTLMNSFKMDEGTILNYIHSINSSKPELIRGYAASLFEVSNYAQSHSFLLHHPLAIVSSAEMLTPKMRKVVETTFGRKVYDFYGSREISSLAGQCTEGLFHVLAFHNLLEVLDEFDRPVGMGQEGRVIVTELHNYSMPLIRYEIGDLATLGPGECKCGTFLPSVASLNGRISEYFLNEDGGLVYPHALSVDLAAFGWIESFQIIQENFKTVRILIVPHGNINNCEKDGIDAKIKFLLGYDCEIIWDLVSEIPLTPQGKRRYAYSMVERNAQI